MSFINSTTGQVYAPGYFLGREDCARVTFTGKQALATIMPDGSKIIKAGTAFPSNDGNIVGFFYEDVDVTTGDMPASIAIRGCVYINRLPQELTSEAKEALEANGWIIADDTPVTRPDDGTTANGENAGGGTTGDTGDDTTGGGTTGGGTTGG